MVLTLFFFFFEPDSYFTRVKLGTPPNELYVQIDTRSDVLWVTCNACSGCPKYSGLNVKLSFFFSFFPPPSSSFNSIDIFADEILTKYPDFNVVSPNILTPSEEYYKMKGFSYSLKEWHSFCFALVTTSQNQGLEQERDWALKLCSFNFEKFQAYGWHYTICSLSVNVSIISGKDEFINTGQLSVRSSSEIVPCRLISSSTVAMVFQLQVHLYMEVHR